MRNCEVKRYETIYIGQKIVKLKNTKERERKHEIRQIKKKNKY
jgi:hypothetical protein